MKREGLFAFGTIGLPNDKSIKLDESFDFKFNLTENDIKVLNDSINIGLITFIDIVREMMERIDEYYFLQETVLFHLKEVNEKIKGQYIRFSINSNLNETINFVESTSLYIGYWAVLCINDRALFDLAKDKMISFMKEDFKTDNLLDLRRTSKHEDKEHFMDMGKEARDGHSIFDRCVYHYKNIFKEYL